MGASSTGVGEELHQLINKVISDESERKKIDALLSDKLSVIVRNAETNKGSSPGLSPESVQKLALINSLLNAIGDQHLSIVSQIVCDSKVRDLSDVGTCYYSEKGFQTEGDPLFLPTQERTVFLSRLYDLEPTAVLKGLVSYRLIPTEYECTPLVVDILTKAVEQRIDMRKSSVNAVLKDYEAPQGLPPFNLSEAARNKAISNVQDLQRIQALVSAPEQIGNIFQFLATGTRSANTIAMTHFKTFSSQAEAAGLTPDEAKWIHGNAVTVNMRNEQTWVSLLKSKTEVLLPALRPSIPAKKPKEETSEQSASFVTIFKEMESFECKDCESVLSPAAYLVDLLRFLDSIRLNNHLALSLKPEASWTLPDGTKVAAEEVTLLKLLSRRRPDLKELKLSCANTKTTLPYIDLVNEVLESFISKTLDKKSENGPNITVEIDAFNTKESDTSDGCVAEPRHVNTKVYRTHILNQVYPLTVFPYNHAADSMRCFMPALGSSVSELRKILSAPYRRINATQFADKIKRSRLLKLFKAVQRRSVATETLGLQQEDLVAITRESFYPIEYLRLTKSVDAVMTINEYQEAIKFVGVPRYWGYNSDSDMLDSTRGKGLMFIKTQFLPRSGLSLEELVDLLKTQYIGGRLIITSVDGTKVMSGTLDDLRLRPSVLVGSQASLTVELCHQLQAFIRLRKILGWSLATLDAALCCFSRQHAQRDYFITADDICGLAAIQELSEITSIEKILLLPLWGDIDTNGSKSLYASLFLGPAKTGGELFAETKGKYLAADTSHRFSEAAQVLASVLRVSATDLLLLQELSELPEDPLLTLSNVSAVYRVAMICRVLGISIKKYKLFISIFKKSYPDIYESPDSTLSVVKYYRSFTAGGWSLDILALTLGIEAPESAKEKAIKLCHSVIESAKMIESTWAPLESDTGNIPTEEDVTRVSALLFGPETAAGVVQFVEGNTLEVALSQCSIQKIEGPLSTSIILNKKKLRLIKQLTSDEKLAALALETDPALQKSTWQPAIEELMSSFASMQAFLDLNFGKNWTVGLSPASSPEILDSRRRTFLKKAVSVLKLQLLNQQIFDAVQSDFQNIDSSILRLVLSDIAKFNETSALATLGSIPSKAAKDAADLRAGYFWPSTTDKYWFEVDSPSSILAIDGVNVKFSDSDQSSKKRSQDVRFISGQIYHIQFSDQLDELVFGTKRALKSKFPLNALIGQSVIDLAAHVYRTIERITTLISTASLSLEEVQFFGGSFKSVEINFASVNLEKISKLQAYRFIRDEVCQKDKTDLLSFYKWVARLMPVKADFTSSDVQAYIAEAENAEREAEYAKKYLSELDTAYSNEGEAAKDRADEAQAKANAARTKANAAKANLDASMAPKTTPDGPTSELPNSESLEKAIAKLGSWSEPFISELLRAKYPQLGEDRISLIELFNNVEELAELKAAIEYIKNLNLKSVTIAQLFAWAEPPESAEASFQSADELRAALHDIGTPPGGMKSVASLAHDKLRENQRKVLVEYLLNHEYFIKYYPLEYRDADSLFEYFLIDVNMGALLQTSRIKQAISTIQLFVQRCTLGLEHEVGNTAELSAQMRSSWPYMRKYGLWEANRKVFLYPENWIDPSLRDDKSEQFLALESTVLQNDISMDSITEAVKNYVFDTNQLAHLDIQAYLWERRTITEEAKELGRFHFFARTRTVPYHFYYRRLELDYFGVDLSYWYPWTKLDLGGVPTQTQDKDSSGSNQSNTYLVPSVVKGRLYLFIPEITLNAVPNPKNSKDTITILAGKTVNEATPVQNTWEIKMGCIELRDGKWSSKIVSADSIIVGETGVVSSNGSNIIAVKSLPKISEFRFRVRARDPQDNDSVTAAAAKASFHKGVRGVLVIDVETFTFDAIKKIYSPVRLGQFEMRDSYIYTAKSLKEAWEGARDTSTPSSMVKPPITLPTQFSRVTLEVMPPDSKKNPIPVTTPDYQMTEKWFFNEGNAPAERILDANPIFIDVPSTEQRSLTWTMSFDDTQFSKPLGLVVDVRTNSKGPQTFFGVPHDKSLEYRETAVKIDSQSQIIPLDYLVSARLMERASTSKSLELVFDALNEGFGRKQPYAADREVVFGGFGGFQKNYHELHTPYSAYSWELGVHAVLLLMERLLATQQFEPALKIARLVFDPTLQGSDLSDCWLFPPFKELKTQTTAELLRGLESKARGNQLTFTDLAVREWQHNPFNAHSAARSRPITYMKRIVMKYIEILIAAGDEYFRQNTLESIPLAIQYYIEAAHLYGPALKHVKPFGKRTARSYNELLQSIDRFSNATLEMELEFPFSCLQAGMSGSPADPKGERPGLLGFVTSSYFCVPTNPQLIALRDRIDDRLTKIRNCQDINGNFQKLALFEPPLDPGALVQAQAAGGLGASMLMTDFDTPMPNYRFFYLLSKALEMTSELSSMAEFFLSAREKRDSEALSLLKNRQETTLQSMITEYKNLQKEEAQKSIQAMEDLRDSHVSRLRYYLQLIGEPMSKVPGVSDEWSDIVQNIDKPSDDDLKMSSYEKEQMDKANDSADRMLASSILDTTGAFLMALPNPSVNVQPMGVGVTVECGPQNIAKALTGASSVLKTLADHLTNQSLRAGRKADLIRQLQDRKLQANLAGRDIKNLDKQVAAQRVRIAMCDSDLKTQKLIIAQAIETEEWYKSKYSNEKLYAWMENCSRSLLYETYVLAIEFAKKAEKTFMFERGSNTISFLSNRGYWDSGRDGLFAAQNLHLALKRMEMAYVDSSNSDFEITKTVSLRQLNPIALFELRNKGITQVTIPEVLFDMDFPGHYFRRIKSIAVSVPCVSGPYVNLNCTLNLLQHKYRISPNSTGYKYDGDGDSEKFRTDRIPISSIAISDRQADTGTFQLDFNGERYLPFENAGAISTWSMELPQNMRQFDYDTISDVVFQIRYTSKQGGAALKKAAEAAVRTYVSTAVQMSSSEGLYAITDIKNDYSNAFAGFTRSANKKPRKMTLANLDQNLPYWARMLSPKATGISLLLRTPLQKKTADATNNAEPKIEGLDKAKAQVISGQTTTPLGRAIPLPNSWTSFGPDGTFDMAVDSWTLELSPSSGNAVLANIDKALLIIQYTVTTTNASP